MYTRLGRSKRLIPAVLGIVTLACVAVLLSWDAFPKLFPAGSHEVLAAFSLAMIALAYSSIRLHIGLLGVVCRMLRGAEQRTAILNGPNFERLIGVQAAAAAAD